ncbi:MAG TPA: HD domain-containing phosphohydrolase, partial [Longimicrobiales bacterium]|nr:HD domain-containing phosphohydrolase [Longimicrobiales bacterium]
DQVLRGFAEVLAGLTRAMHLSARFGGEEFIFILDESDAAGATVLAEKVRTALKAREFPCGQVTVSGGIAEYEPGMASPEVLVAAADQALYRAKEGGRDRVVVMGQQGAEPPTTTPMAEPPTRVQPTDEGHGELVLVVDDDPAVLRTLARGLRRRRYHPIEASDPHHALEIARGLTEPLDLVITDVVMPGMSGFRLVEMLMETQPELRALYISGYSREEVRWSGVPGTVKAFLAKPILLDALTRATRKVLDAPLRSSVRRASPTPHFRDRAALQDRLTAQAAQLEEAQGEILARLAWAAEYRDYVTGSHAERVSWLAGRLARELGQDDDAVGRIEKAALLHDLGKIGVPDAVLKKPGELTEDERELMQEHCLVGARILSGSRHALLREAELIARSHHERWDGGGYPDGLSGEDIPLSARITAVADTLDSLTHDRPYREGITHDAALTVIREERGHQFDPGVVDALFRLEERGELRTLEETADVAGEWVGQVPTGTGYKPAWG